MAYEILWVVIGNIATTAVCRNEVNYVISPVFPCICLFASRIRPVVSRILPPHAQQARTGEAVRTAPPPAETERIR